MPFWRLGLLVLILPWIAGAQTPWLPRVAKGFQEAPGWKIQFEWTLASSGGLAPPRTSQGSLKLARDGRFVLQAPGLRAMSDGVNSWQYTEAAGQVVLRSVSGLDPSQSPVALLQAALQGSETASANDTLDRRTVRMLELDLTRGPLSRFRRARLWVDPSSLRPLRLEVVDGQGGRQSWKLLQAKRWGPSSKDFVWVHPKGAEVVDLRP